MPTSKVDRARSVVPAAKAKTSPSAWKGLPRKARKPAMLPMSDGDAGVQAYIASMEPWQAAIAKHATRWSVHESLEGSLEETLSFGRRP